MADSRIPAGVIACSPAGRLAHLPPEDIAEIQAFAAFLTATTAKKDVACSIEPIWHPPGECPSQYVCTPQGETP